MTTATIQERSTPVDWGPMGLGTGTLASLGRKATVTEVQALLDAMEAIGARTIDTADSYGSGDCEHLLARATAGRRDHFRIVTKAGYRMGNLPGPLRPLNQFLKKARHRLGDRQCFSIKYLTQCLDQSLKRLKTDRVEAFMLHDPPLETVGLDEIAEFFRHIKQQGKALSAGISSGDADVLKASLAMPMCDLMECPANIAAPDALLEVWQECAERGVHLIGNHVFEPQSLASIGINHQILMQASVALLPSGATILCGTRNPAHLRLSHEWARTPLPVAEAMRLRALRLG